MRERIIELIGEKREGSYWDFKQEYHTNKAKLLHDILCLANNIDNKEAYLIFGIADNGDVVGLSEDKNRKNQEFFISFLQGKKFAGNNAPHVVLKTISVKEHEIDILIIKKSNRVPFYLEEDFKIEKSRVSTGNIYTRIEDKNTPINETADPLRTEELWKIRLGLLPTPSERLKSYLLQKDLWSENRLGRFFIEAPEFTVVENEEETQKYDRYSAPFYAYIQMNNSYSYYSYECKYLETILFERQTVRLDSGRYHTPIPEMDFIGIDTYGQDNLYYRYFIKDTMLYNMHIFMVDFTDEEAVIAHRKFMELVVVFENKNEKVEFERYIREEMSRILLKREKLIKENPLKHYNELTEGEKDKFNTNFETGILLVKELEEFRQFRRDNIVV